MAHVRSRIYFQKSTYTATAGAVDTFDNLEMPFDGYLRAMSLETNQEARLTISLFIRGTDMELAEVGVAKSGNIKWSGCLWIPAGTKFKFVVAPPDSNATVFAAVYCTDRGDH